MKGKPKNWVLVEMYEGNFIFEDQNGKFQVSIDKMGRISPPYNIHYSQLKGTLAKIQIEDAYFTVAENEEEAFKKAYRMMNFLNSKAKL